MMFHHQRFLPELINENKFQKVVEVGVDGGHTSKIILEACPTITEYYMIDPWRPYGTPDGHETSKCFIERTLERWEEVYQAACERVKDFPAARIIRMPSQDAAGCFEVRSLDLVFLDGDHSYRAVKADIAAWRGFVRPGGILCGHDYGAYGVAPAVNECFSVDEFKVTHSTWVVRIA